MSLLLFNRALYPNLARAALAGNGVTMAGSFLTRFSQKAWLFLPFGNQALGPLGDIAFNTCWIFAVICVVTILLQSESPRRSGFSGNSGAVGPPVLFEAANELGLFRAFPPAVSVPREDEAARSAIGCLTYARCYTVHMNSQFYVDVLIAEWA